VRRRGSTLRTVALAAVGLLVLVTFLARRSGIVPGGPPPFDPEDYADVPVVEAVQAAELEGDRAVVCGRVVHAVFAQDTGGRPTYLNLEQAYPDQPFDVVIWGRDRDRFHPPPEVAYRDQRICVAGQVTTHRGTPRIEVVTPEQIRSGSEAGPGSRWDP